MIVDLNGWSGLSFYNSFSSAPEVITKSGNKIHDLFTRGQGWRRYNMLPPTITRKQGLLLADKFLRMTFLFLSCSIKTSFQVVE